MFIFGLILCLFGGFLVGISLKREKLFLFLGLLGLFLSLFGKDIVYHFL